MSEQMTFPDTWEEYEAFYGFTDKEEIYTNGSRLIPSFRVKQWLDHLDVRENVRGEWIPISSGERGYSAGDFRCSVCNQPNRCYSLTNYCPNCGADMRGDINDVLD